ncbi:MAG: OmpA/MotB family protein [Thermoguttaceae bacterium]
MAGAGGGGAWKVAYADFVTAMMAFFMVMWILGQGQDVKEAVADYFENPGGNSLLNGGGSPLLGPNQPGQPVGPSMARPRSDGKPAGTPLARKGSAADGSPDKVIQGERGKDSDLLVIHAGDRRLVGGVIVLPEGKSELDEKSKERLSRIADALRGKPQKIEVRGHATRSSPGGKGGGEEEPWRLSYARCLAAMDFLVTQGIAPERIRLSQGGAYEPYSIDADPEQQMYNSRVEVYVLSELTEDFMGTPEERAKHFSNF